jgi:MbtH protein
MTMSDAKKAGDDATSIDGDSFAVLVNAEGQYSIWPARKAVPAGWSRVGPTGPKADCTAYIETHWTDMRVRSLALSMNGEKTTRK